MCLPLETYQDCTPWHFGQLVRWKKMRRLQRALPHTYPVCLTTDWSFWLLLDVHLEKSCTYEKTDLHIEKEICICERRPTYTKKRSEWEKEPVSLGLFGGKWPVKIGSYWHMSRTHWVIKMSWTHWRFGTKWPVKIGHPMTLRHPVAFLEQHLCWYISTSHISTRLVLIYQHGCINIVVSTWLVLIYRHGCIKYMN